MELIFVADRAKADRYNSGCGKFGYWDILKGKIWVWLFNFKPDMDDMVERLCYVIEHEWLHELFAHNVSYRYRGLGHWIIWLLQSWRATDVEWELAINRR